MQNVLTTQQLKDLNLDNFESSLAQTIPINSKAFLRVLAALEAGGQTQLVKFGIERVLQTSALTATEEDLEKIGELFQVFRKAAEATVLTATLPGTDATIIPIITAFTGSPNGIRYFTDFAATIIGGIATLSLTAEEEGTDGNLNDGDELAISTQIAGAETIATVTSTTTTGSDQEDQEVYRTRVLSVMRASIGGSTATDHKIWGEEVSGVVKIYPYSGNPYGYGMYPAERLIYVEVDTSIDPDGIPDSDFLDQVRDAISTDPDTSLSNPVLGLTDDNLYVEAIIRTTFNCTITNLIVDADLLTQTEEDIDTALTLYFLAVFPYVVGVDLLIDKNNVITKLSLSTVVQDILDTAGGYADSITFNIPAGPSLDNYELGQGEKAKLGTITYA
ncbi:MAG: baseplate J/gp47 family protein [Gammaproteobacteria bacterium]|nr:baseplate J/gp47 family protein [Gammaproteobacteria bacterium]